MQNTNLEIVRGDTVPLTIRVTVAGAVFNITGYSFFFTAKNKVTDADADAVISKKVTTLTDASNGVVTITLSASDTALPCRPYQYDIQAVSGTGVVTTLFMGTLTIVQDVTQRVA